MKEINDIIKAYEEAHLQNKQTVLATVVHVEGSSYRKAGARMLVTEDGMLTGAISGGCLEGDALRKALLAIAKQKNMLVVYDTSDEDDARFGMGLGCNGIIHVLLEPVNPVNTNNPIHLLKSISAKRQKAAAITLFSMQNKKEEQPGTCLVLTEDGSILGGAPFLKDVLLAEAKHALDKQQSFFKNYMFENRNLTAFAEMFKPTVSLVITGAGNDVVPLVKMSEIAGWKTTVIDGRPAYAKKERFVASCQVLLSRPEDVLGQVSIDEQTVFVLMTHNYNYDIAMLRALLKTEVTYIGMLGSRNKINRMLNELRYEGTNLSQQQLSVIHSPIGLDIGAETSEEIALSVMAEIKAVLAKKGGAFLKNNAEGMYSHAETKIEKVKFVSEQ
jgi:xanthine dehydrogenase accessory factor